MGDEKNKEGKGKEALTPLGPKPIPRKNEQSDEESMVEVDGVIGKGREASASSSFSRGSATVGAGSSETRSSQEGEAHPCLFIDNILDVIFKHIINQSGTGQEGDDDEDEYVRKRVHKDVRNIRQVCKRWKTSITRLYRETDTAVTFIYGDVMKDEGLEWLEWWSGSRQPLANFLYTMRPSQMIPVQKYTFKVLSVLGPKGGPELFREFLVMCGPEAVSLDFTIGSCYESETITLSLMDLPELNLGKLTRLKLTIFENDQVALQANRIPGNVKLIELLLTAAKSLQEFELSYPSHPNRDQEDNIFVQQLVPVIANRLPASVKQLTLLVQAVNLSGFDALAGIQSQLKGFKLVLSGRPYDFPMGSKPICKFLQSQANTLQHFQLMGYIKRALVDFPRLHELTQLEMKAYDGGSMAPFECAKIFPKLQFLKIEGEVEVPVLTSLSSTEKPLGSLKVLHLPTWMEHVEPGVLKGIAKSFPCVEELRVGEYYLPKELFKEVFTYFNNLELLNITEFSSSNCVESMAMLSGIAESECSRIVEAQDFEKESMKELQRGPSLLNLTKLRKLFVCRSCSLRFTNFSAHFVFLEMENLRELNLPYEDVEFSPKYRDLLEAKLDKLVLSGCRRKDDGILQ